MFSVSCAVVVKKNPNQTPKKFAKLKSHGHFIEVFFFLPLNKEESEEFELFMIIKTTI